MAGKLWMFFFAIMLICISANPPAQEIVPEKTEEDSTKDLGSVPVLRQHLDKSGVDIAHSSSRQTPYSRLCNYVRALLKRACDAVDNAEKALQFACEDLRKAEESLNAAKKKKQESQDAVTAAKSRKIKARELVRRLSSLCLGG